MLIGKTLQVCGSNPHQWNAFIPDSGSARSPSGERYHGAKCSPACCQQAGDTAEGSEERKSRRGYSVFIWLQKVSGFVWGWEAHIEIRGIPAAWSFLSIICWTGPPHQADGWGIKVFIRGHRRSQGSETGNEALEEYDHEVYDTGQSGGICVEEWNF